MRDRDLMSGDQIVQAAWVTMSAAAAADAAARVYGRGAAGAYAIRNLYGRRGYDEIETFGFGRPGTQAFYGVGSKHAILAFRGTEPDRVEDWLSDFNIDLVRAPYGEGRVHEGFLGAFSALGENAISRIIDLAARRPLMIAGHSLGGALATICAARLVAAGRPPAVVYTFGSPRVGNGDFVRTLADVPFYRVVNCADLVARRPVILTAFGYRHAGDLRYINRAGKVIRGSSPLTRMADQVAARLGQGHILSAGVRHHSAGAYARALLSLAR